MSCESDGCESMDAMSSVKPAKKKHTGENALRRFFPDNFSALHRTQGVLYAFDSAEEARAAGISPVQLIKLKRSVLQWVTIPVVIMKGLNPLPDTFTAIGCCAADAVLNRVDPHRAFIVIRTPESGKGQWNIVALYNPPQTVICDRASLNAEVAEVYKNEQASKKSSSHKGRSAKESLSIEGSPVKSRKQYKQQKLQQKSLSLR